MRRAAMAVIVGGYTFWGIGSGLGHQPVSIGASLTAAVQPVKTPVKTAEPATPGRQTVKFDGYTVSVPASWPVYDLNKDPRRCVRYDVHAVYLGTPGPDQDCPPNLVGRVETVSILGPAGTNTGPAGTKTALARAKIAGDRKAPVWAGQPALTPGTIVQDPDLHELALAMPDTAPRIDATYGTDPGAAEQLLATMVPAGTQAATQPGATRRAGDSIRVTRHPVIVEAANLAQVTNPAWPRVTPPPTGLPPGWTPPGWTPPGWTPPDRPSTPPDRPSTPPDRPSSPPSSRPSTPAPTPSPTGPALADSPSPSPSPSQPPSPSPSPSSQSSSSKSSPSGAMAGFDTCAAPSLPTMKAWRAKYAATAIYIGGQMMACGQSNLSASWVQQAEAMGWSLMPTFVGLQAPCDSFSGKINARQAAAQGTAAANQAIADAKAYGLGAGSPVYYDMEAYDHTKSACRTAVLTFLDAWTRQLRADGYVSGVYSSADAAIIDLQSTATIAGHSLAEPQAIWFALWDNASNLTGAPYVTSSVWPVSSRSKQYAGGHIVKVGGISLDIDADWVAGAVARG